MSVKQLPDGSWYYRFQVGKRFHRKQGFRNKTEAENAETTKKAEALRRSAYTYEANDDLKLSEAMDLFFEEYARPFKRTWVSDRAHIAVMKAFFGDRKIRDIRPRDVEAFRAYTQRTVKNRQGKPIGLHTVNHYHKDLKAIINWVKKKRLYTGDNPAWGVEMAKVAKARVRFLLPDEEKRLTPVAAKHSRLWPYYVVGLHTGMRLAELWATRVKDVVRHPDPMIFIPNSKSSRSRYVPLYGKAAEVVEQCLKKAHSPEMRLFEPVTKMTISHWFNEACYEAKVPNFTFHCLRHTFAGHMLGQGVPIYIVSKILGHSAVGVTEQHYGHLDKSVFNREIHRIGSVMTLPEPLKVVMDMEKKPEAVNLAVNPA